MTTRVLSRSLPLPHPGITYTRSGEPLTPKIESALFFDSLNKSLRGLPATADSSKQQQASAGMSRHANTKQQDISMAGRKQPAASQKRTANSRGTKIKQSEL